jgi:hypothetical protein
MKYFSAFTGVGGLDMGMPPDWECIGHSEIDRYANMVLRYRFEDVKNYGDAEKIDWEEVPDFDMLVGGTPCQDGFAPKVDIFNYFECSLYTLGASFTLSAAWILGAN